MFWIVFGILSPDSDSVRQTNVVMQILSLWTPIFEFCFEEIGRLSKTGFWPRNLPFYGPHGHQWSKSSSGNPSAAKTNVAIFVLFFCWSHFFPKSSLSLGFHVKARFYQNGQSCPTERGNKGPCGLPDQKSIQKTYVLSTFGDVF